MMNRVTLLLVLLSLLINTKNTHAQGCSDAGFCTMGAMKPDQPFNKKIELRLRSMEISFYRGTTTLTPIVYVATADLNFSLSTKTSFQIKLPYQAVTGRLGKTSGLGDISICVTRNLLSTEKFDINFSIGGKIPSNKSNKKSEEGNPLPMYYQTSLGTYDLIGGISLISRNWLIATGIQHPFNHNQNDFLWSHWQSNDINELNYVNEYPKARKLKRGTDVMFRVERNFRFSRMNFSIGLLPIYRLNHDVIVLDNGTELKPKGAIGLAMSGIATAGYSFNVRSGVKLLIGRKITQRENNPDGLTRHLVTTISYVYRF